MLIVLMLRFI